MLSPDGPMGSGPLSELLPGWQLLKGTNTVTTLDLNIITWTNTLSLVSASTKPFGLGRYVEGPYGLAQSDTSNIPITLIQRGDIPPEAEVLEYKYLGMPFEVALNGEILSSFPEALSATSTTTKFASFRISKFAGKNVQLKLTQTTAGLPPGPGVHIASFIDRIVLREASNTDFWFQRDTSGATAVLLRAAGGNGSLVAVGWNGTILWSADGQKWSPQDSGTTNHLRGVAFGDRLWVAVGNGTILSSSDERQWTRRYSNTNVTFHAATYARGLFVAVGAGPTPLPSPCPSCGTGAAIWTSSDGATWTERSAPPAGVLNDVIYVPEYQAFVAVGDATVPVSTDGQVWSRLATDYLPPLALAVAFGKGLFVVPAGGQGIYTSTNASNWDPARRIRGRALRTGRSGLL